jgi:hypothetical protein
MLTNADVCRRMLNKQRVLGGDDSLAEATATAARGGRGGQGSSGGQRTAATFVNCVVEKNSRAFSLTACSQVFLKR